MTIVYEILKRRFIFENTNKMDEILINYRGMPTFFCIREFVIITGLKYHPLVESIPEYIVKTEPRRKKVVKEVAEAGQ